MGMQETRTTSSKKWDKTDSTGMKEPGKKTDKVPAWLVMVKSMIVSGMITVVMILAVAFATYKLQWGEKSVSLAIVAIYVAATLGGGWIAGKSAGKRKFVWGLLTGITYFLILAIVSLAVNGEGAFTSGDFLTTALICMGGGMLGGMIA